MFLLILVAASIAARFCVPFDKIIQKLFCCSSSPSVNNNRLLYSNFSQSGVRFRTVAHYRLNLSVSPIAYAKSKHRTNALSR